MIEGLGITGTIPPVPSIRLDEWSRLQRLIFFSRTSVVVRRDQKYSRQLRLLCRSARGLGQAVFGRDSQYQPYTDSSPRNDTEHL